MAIDTAVHQITAPRVYPSLAQELFQQFLLGPAPGSSRAGAASPRLVEAWFCAGLMMSSMLRLLKVESVANTTAFISPAKFTTPQSCA